MVRLFVTGDNHFGKKYDRYPDVKDILIESRFESFREMVHKAEAEECDMFVITGDLFDNISTIKKSDVERIVDILSEFNGDVLVLPGNHDYYTGDEKVWKTFKNALLNVDHNITLLNEFRKYCFDVGDEKVNIYPAYCQSKHSRDNNLKWIKNETIDKSNGINIGIAHGAIEGVTPDLNGEYFMMSERELNEISMDVWLIGHTHIPYPNDLKENEDVTGYRIFNAGTHEQTDLHNNTEGNCFIVSVEKMDGVSKVYARRYISGKMRYFDLKINVSPDNDAALRNAILREIEAKEKNAVIRCRISGVIKQSEYEDRNLIYKEILSSFLSYEVDDSELSEEISPEKVCSEFAETSFAAMYIERFYDNPTELQMAYQLMCQCREEALS